MPTLTSATDYLENALLNLVLRGVAFAPPAGVHAQLYTSAPSDTGGGTTTGSRAAVTFGAPATRSSANSAGVTITGASGSVTHVALFDAASGGNMLLWGELDAPVSVGSGEPFEFQPGDLRVTFLAGAMTDYLAHALLNHVLRATAFTAPSTITLALLDGSDVEVSGGGYSRLALTFGAASGGQVANTNEGSFTNLPSVTVAAFHYHAGSGGQALFAGTLAPRTVASGGTLNVNAGAFTAAID